MCLLIMHIYAALAACLIMLYCGESVALSTPYKKMQVRTSNLDLDKFFYQVQNNLRPRPYIQIELLGLKVWQRCDKNPSPKP
jgi:hypothetical protein